MNRLIIIVFCLLCTSVWTSYLSQGIIDWADPNVQRIERNANYKVLGAIGDKYYVLSERNDNKTLYTYSIDHRLLSKEPYNVFNNNREWSVQEIITTPRDTFFYIHELSQKNNEWVLYKCDYNNGQFSKPEEIYFENYDDISDKRLRNTYAQYEIENGSSGGFIMSADSSHLAFVNVITRTDHSQKEVVSCIVFDSAMQEKWRGSFDYEFSDQRVTFKTTQLANNGIPYMLVELEADPKKIKGIVPLRYKNLPRTKYAVYRIDQSGILEAEVNIGDDLGIVDANLIFPSVDSSDYIIAGQYSDGDKGNRATGLFWCKGNPELEISDVKITPFGEKLKNEITFDFRINNMLRFSDDRVGFVAEYYRVVRDNNNFNTFNSFNRFNAAGGVFFTYYSGDILLPIFDSEGNVLNMNYIQRRFEVSSDLFSHYTIAESDNHYFLFYNTTKSGKEAKALGLKGRMFTDMMKLSKTGELQFIDTVFSERDDNFLFVPIYVSGNGNYSIVGGLDGNELILAKVLME
jgi:hypothetical protein